MNRKQANPEMIILVRESRGLTQKELAEKLNISPAQLSRIEVGLRTIRKEQLSKLSGALNYPTGLFMQQQPIYGLGISEFYHRKHKDISDRLLNQIYARIHLRLRELEKLMNEVDVGKADIRPIQVDDFNGDTHLDIILESWGIDFGFLETINVFIGDGTGEFLWPRQQSSTGKWFGFDRKILARKRAKYLDRSQYRAQYYNNPNDPDNASIGASKFQ